MARMLNLLVREGDKARLLAMAEEQGATASRGPMQGLPSISKLVKMIVDGRIVLKRRHSSID